jgi:hypothetical protein
MCSSLPRSAYLTSHDSYAENESAKRVAVVAALLRLGTKYAVTYLRDIALRRLEIAAPSSRRRFIDCMDEGDDPTLDWYHRPHVHHLLLALARECAAPVLLPAGLFESSPHTSEVSWPIGRYTSEDGRLYDATEDDLRAAFLGAWRLADRLRAARLKAVASRHACVETRECLLALPTSCRAATADVVFTHVTDSTEGLEAFVIEQVKGWFEDILGFCEACAEHAATVWQDEKDSMWQDLPGLYNLPPWDILIEQTAQATAQ